MRTRLHIVGRLTLAGALAVSASAQVTVGTVEGFDASEYHPAPDNTQVRWRITGAKAEPQERASVLLTDMKLRVFGKRGEPELSVDTPQCLYDSAKRFASSPGRLKVEVNEGRFVIEGEGFLWRQTQETNWTLIISNQVAATVPRPTTNDARAFMTIAARRFAFDSAKHEAVFSEGVLAEDAESELKCEILTAATLPGSSTPDTLRLERRVSILSKVDQLSASADSAAYVRTNETFSLTGNVAWQQGSQSGRARRVVMRRQEKEFVADEQVTVQLPRDALGLGGLLSANTNAASPAAGAGAPLNLTAQQLLVRSNLTLISGGVVLRDETNQLACDKVTIETAGKEQVATATGNVAVCRGDQDQCLRAERAVYKKSLGAAAFTGEPRWKLDQTEGRAQEITLRETGEIRATGDVAARVTLAGRSNSFLSLFPNPGHTNQSAQVLELFARELTASKALVTLSGNARVHQSPLNGSEPHLRCETLALHFTTNSSQVELMEAKDNVRFEQGTMGVTNGPDAYSRLTAARLTATCNPTNGALVQLVADGGVQADQPGSVAQADRATFTAATEILVLTGSPSLRTPEAFVTGAEKIVWNRKTRHVSAKGHFEGEAKGEALRQKLDPTKPAQP